MSGASLDFFYEFASPYSYLAAMRIAAVAEGAGVAVRWRPFLLGPIFQAQGYVDSPFNTLPLKRAHMWRDMERLTRIAHLPPLTRPEPFPAHALLAARVAAWLDDASRPAFSRAVFFAEFAQGRDISDRETVRQVLAGLGHFCDDIIADAEAPANKERLRAETEAAKSLGVFGAPSFVTADGELFWGNDRLEMALDHARALRDGAAPRASA
ncbi:2-hydroxychromene-2-carboxylate isomerase [Xanthobacter pseudotagetidis]|uniref:2-hydroxychromene-2-carboxylate isomerase n=1 Tax=Xanthobacter pseudotagetidis TaxID=3119911 RepID=UPI0037284A56